MIFGIENLFEIQEKAVSIDASKSGMFIATRDGYIHGDELFIRVKELSSDELIGIRVRRVIPWGVGMQIPGIGVEFTKIAPSQIKEVESFLKK